MLHAPKKSKYVVTMASCITCIRAMESATCVITGTGGV